MNQSFTEEDLQSIIGLNATPNKTAPAASPDVSTNSTAIQHDTQSSDELALEFEDDFDEEADPLTYRSVSNFASSPLARLGLVGLGTLSLVSVAGVFMVGLQGQVKESAQKETPSPTNPTPSPSPAVPEQQSAGELKATMAFQTQSQALQNQKLTPPNDASKTAAVTPPPQVKPESNPIPESVPAPPPATVAVSAPPPPLPEPIRTEPIIASTPVPTTPIDPNKAWNELAQSATYGSLPVMIAPPPPPPPPPSPPVAVTPVAKASAEMAGLPTLSSHKSAEASPASQRKLRIGTQVKATLLTPIAWAGDGKEVAFSSNGAPVPKFIARLDQPLKDVAGNEVVPEGAEIVLVVRSLEPRSGMAELTALQMIINDQEFAPPAGAITLRGANGNPLIADKFQDKGKEIAAADRAIFLFGALSKVGELLNRTDSSVVVTATGSASSTSAGKPNVLGGILQGGFGTLAQQQQQRNQQWLQEIIQRPDIRYIPAGKELSLYINQTILL